MSEIDLLKHSLQSLNCGIALADPETWQIRFENAKFFRWFPPLMDGDERLERRLQTLDADRAKRWLRDERPFTWETDVRDGARTVNLSVELRHERLNDRDYLLIECHNVSKLRQIECMLESYSRMVEKNTRALEREKERAEKLLLNVMPRCVYEEMKDFGTATPQRFDEASVLMLDFVDFTEMAISRDPSTLIAELNDIFSAFDRIVDLFDCDRIKTIGDAYIAVSGLPDANADHACNIARVALRMRRYLERRNASHPTQWKCRIGIATGPIIGSLVGIRSYVYDVFGPAVNLAARLESACAPMQIIVSERTAETIRDDFMITICGERALKGFGTQTLLALNDEAPAVQARLCSPRLPAARIA